MTSGFAADSRVLGRRDAAAGLRRSVQMRAALLALAFALLGPLPARQAAAAEADSGRTAYSLTVAGENRTYLVTRPATAPDGPAPTVIALHGAMQSAEGFRDYFGLDATAAKAGVVTVYPQGLGRVWNDGRPAAMRLKAMLRPGKDVEFLLALTGRLVEEGLADPRRIYLAGISNGGFMVERMACEHSGLYAAYAVVMATTPTNYREECQPSRPVPIMFIHGTADTVITYDGFWTPLGSTFSAPDSAAFYASLDGCAGGDVSRLPDLTPLDGTTVTLRQWHGCRDGVAVLLYSVERGGHQSPARVDTIPDMATAFLGLRNHDIDAGEEALRFFSGYALPPAAQASAAPASAASAAPLPVPSPRRAARTDGQAVRRP